MKSAAPTCSLTPRQAVQAMIQAGAVFAVRHRDDGLGVSFTYKVNASGDLQECRRILASVKGRPPQFLDAFKAEVQRVVGSDRETAA